MSQVLAYARTIRCAQAAACTAAIASASPSLATRTKRSGVPTIVIVPRALRVGDMTAADNEIQFRSDMTVELVKASASDADVVFAARVSTKGEHSLEDVEGDPTQARGLAL